jgi:hypothetical protein
VIPSSPILSIPPSSPFISLIAASILPSSFPSPFSPPFAVISAFLRATSSLPSMRLLKLSPLPPEPEVGDVGDVRLGGGGVVPVEEVSARTEAMASCWVEWGFGF